MPSLEDLKPFVNDITNAAMHFGVSERTVRRWFHASGLTKKKSGWGPKLKKSQVNEIHRMDRDGFKIVEIAKIMNVSHVAISKILNGQSHTLNGTDTAIVSVIYNTN
jgi:transposase